MKTSLLVTLLAGLIFYYFHYSPPAAHAVEKAVISAPPTRPAPASQTVIIASAPSAYSRWTSSSDRWKNGPNAQTDLRIGPNAQTDFAPFAPNEQETWNQTPGYTMVSGSMPRVH